MSRRSAPGLGQWLLVIAMVVVVMFLLFKLYQYGTFRRYYPAGLTAGGVPVGGLTPEEAAEQLSNRYVDAPVSVYHGEEAIEIRPLDVEFVLDTETRLGQAD